MHRLFVQHGSPRPPHLVVASPWVLTQALAVQVMLPLPSGQASPAAVQVAPALAPAQVVQQQPPALQKLLPQHRWPDPPQASQVFAPVDRFESQLSPVLQPPLVMVSHLGRSTARPERLMMFTRCHRGHSETPGGRTC